MFATAYPDEVAGLVFMDISHENTWKHPEIRKFNIQFGKLTLAGRMASPIGLWRALVRTGVLSHPYLQFAAPQARDVASALTSRTSYWKTIYEETNVNTLDIDAEQVRASRRFLGDLPILVLTAGSGYPDDAYRQHWFDDQADLLSLSSRTEQWVVADATHVSLTTEKPEIVQRAVQSILSKIQTS
jgi:pimeloyl-ACP methyl ester carboxylesterase